MVSKNKLSKINKRHFWGRASVYLKAIIKEKGIAFYNSKMRKLINKIDIDEYRY